MSDPEFEAERQRKIAEIRHTGKTWQWPDPVNRPRRKHPATDWVALVLALAVLGWLIWWGVTHL